MIQWLCYSLNEPNANYWIKRHHQYVKYLILKNPSANAGDLRIADLITGLERSPVAYWAPNAEFQRIARRDNKAFFSDQCKEIEENNRMGKTRDLFKKIRDTEGTFHAKMGSIKDRNGMLTPYLKTPHSPCNSTCPAPVLLTLVTPSLICCCWNTVIAQ